MKPNPKISAAVAAILGASGTAVVFAATPAAETAAEAGLGEVVVTAQRRAENLQDVPITVQAITGAQLQQLNVVSFNDLLKYTPNVSYSGNGPGTGNIYMRGLGGVGSGNQSQSTTAPFPNVALYLDEQSMQFPARNNDVYLVDMERVEILEGPQGTLFGGGAQAGAIRYITNRPKLGVTGGEVNAAYGITAGGDPNTTVNATLNLPFGDSVALRGVIFSERRGGYIDNVAATIGYVPGTAPATLPNGGPKANNAFLVEQNTNPVDYQGVRLSALWKINDNWDALLQQNYQNMEADGYFYAYPNDVNGKPLEKYQLTAFTPAYSKDRYESTALTVNGKLSDLLSIVYAGSYMVRHIEGQQDYSNYMRSFVGSYYACIGTGAGYFNEKNFKGPYPGLTGKPLQCSTPVGNWHDSVRNTHMSHELRLTTNADYRLRGLVGAYFEKFVIFDNMNFNYLGLPQCDPANLAAAAAGGPSCFSAVGPVPGAHSIDPALRENSNTAFGEDDQRGYKQRAVFTSIDFDIIPKVLTVTGGVRFYHYDEFETGSEYYSESTSTGLVVNHANGACTAAGLCGFPINLEKSESGHRWRGNLTWHINQDLMTYYTYSEGFRPGGFNRTSSLPGQPPSLAGVAKYCGNINGVQTAPDPRCLPGGALDGLNTSQFNKPAGFDSDQLTNHEIGFKSEFFDHHLLFNVSGYVMHWTDVQISLFDPVHLGNTTFNVNGPTYKVKGFEVQFVARLTEGLTVEGSSSVNSAEQTSTPCLPSSRPSAGNPTTIGDCITVVKENTYTNPYGVTGTRPPFSPPWMFNARARYDWHSGNYHPFVWVGASHVGPQSNEPASFPAGDDPKQCCVAGQPTTTLLRYEIPGYTTYDAALGVSKDNWTAQITGSNLSNEYGPTNISSGQFIKSEIPLRPRVLQAQFSWSF
ncbi:MAG TPA: TonB-dependent receptor [Steroidobacteraceae bacterium]|nr:TonB-dependent receptor [Steroidobacteraceae bacterium]